MPSARRLLVTGGRYYHDRQYVWGVLDEIDRRFGPVEVLIEGAAGDPDRGTGADVLAARWASKHRIRVDEYQAEWEKYGNPAGPIRNAKMVNHGRPTMGVAFPGNKGTKNCLGLLTKAGVPTVDLWSSGDKRPNLDAAINLLTSSGAPA